MNVIKPTLLTLELSLLFISVRLRQYINHWPKTLLLRTLNPKDQKFESIRKVARKKKRKKNIEHSKGMEGLIPMLLHALKKQRPHHSYRCLSDSSSRSYHVLATPPDSLDGSSHHLRTRSEFQPPAAVDHFLDQRFALESPRSRGFNGGSVLAPASAANGSRQIGSNTNQIWKEINSNLRRREI
ncbi:hypothetical protein U1Q18_035162 [Sarracenia purpurea var. burkii]